MDNTTNTGFTDILEDIFDDDLIEDTIEPEEDQPITDENVNEFVLEYGSKLVKDGMDAIDKLKPKITTGQDADEIASLAELMRAMNATLGTLTKISLQNKKDKSDKANTELTFEHKKELGHTPNTQVIIGTREDIFKRLIESETKTPEIIDVEETPHE